MLLFRTIYSWTCFCCRGIILTLYDSHRSQICFFIFHLIVQYESNVHSSLLWLIHVQVQTELTVFITNLVNILQKCSTSSSSFLILIKITLVTQFYTHNFFSTFYLRSWGNLTQLFDATNFTKTQAIYYQVVVCTKKVDAWCSSLIMSHYLPRDNKFPGFLHKRI